MPVALAPRWAGWARSHANLPGPLLGASLAGVPFLTDVFGPNARLVVEMAFAADVTASADTWSWTDITTDVRYADGGRVNITPVGRGDETSKSQPAGCAFQVDNTAGDYSKGPRSKHFPYVRRNTPVRVRLTLDGSSWYVRFQGLANGFTPSWDTSANLAVVTVSASGTLRRLQQGSSPLKSPSRRAMDLVSPQPIDYWSLEEGTFATQGGNAISGRNPLALTGGSGFGGGEGLSGSQIFRVHVGSGLTASVAGCSSTSWRAEWVARFKTGSAGAFGVYMTQFSTSGSVNQIQVVSDPTDWYLIVWDQVAFSTSGFSGIQVYDGNLHHYRLDVLQSGPDFTVKGYRDGVLEITVSVSAHTIGGCTAAWVGMNSTADTAQKSERDDLPDVGHLAIWNGNPTLSINTPSAGLGWVSETATARLTRLCSEQSTPIQITGSSTTAMGVQGVDTLVNLLRECETTDDGVLYDGRGAGLSYTARTTRYNAATVLTADMSADPPQVGQPFSPVDDDQRNRNLFKVDRKDGSTAIYQDSTGTLGTSAIGIYDSSVTVNASDDTGLAFRAAWEVHKGTVDAPYRHPSLSLDLAAVPVLAPVWLTADVSSRFDVTNVSSRATQYPAGTVSLVLEGWTESLSPFDWEVSANCSPFDPYRIAVIEGSGDSTWRLDSGASAMAAGASVGATSITVNVTDGYLWSTSAGDYPRDLDIGGIQVTAAACAGASSPQTFTVSALAYPLAAGQTVKLWHPPTIAL